MNVTVLLGLGEPSLRAIGGLFCAVILTTAPAGGSALTGCELEPGPVSTTFGSSTSLAVRKKLIAPVLSLVVDAPPKRLSFTTTGLFGLPATCVCSIAISTTTSRDLAKSFPVTLIFLPSCSAWIVGSGASGVLKLDVAAGPVPVEFLGVIDQTNWAPKALTAVAASDALGLVVVATKTDILMATGRDATDVAISTSFGSSRLVHFEVVTEEIAEAAATFARA